MDDNSFLKNYKRNKSEDAAQEQPAPSPASSPEPGPAAPPAARRYEQRSGFASSRGDRGPGSPPGPARRSPLAGIVVAAVLVVAAVAALTWFLNRGVTVIDMAGWTTADAQLWASEKGVNLQIDEQFSDDVASGKVIAQSPEKGEKVSKGGFVKVSVSKGHDMAVLLPLPDLMHMTGEQIQAWADKNFMAKVYITSAFSDTVPTGEVISYQINDNTVVDKVTRNTPISVVVSKGREDDAAAIIVVPDFKQKTLAESFSWAQENGLTLQVQEQYDDYAPKGTILTQSVKADEKVRRGDTITLTVSKGKKVLVPDFSQDSKAKAAAAASQLGIVNTSVEKYSDEPAGAFISQSLPAGSVYEDGDVLELNYSLGNSIVIGSFVGQMRDAIDTWSSGLNSQGASITVKVTSTQADAPKGTILTQDKANTSIAIDAVIHITVSLGKAVFMPDFVAPDGSGYDVAVTRDEAMAMCQAVGVVPVFVAEKKTGRLPGEVWYQSVAPGKEVYQGSTVTLKYVPDNVTVTVADFSGMTQAEILAAGWGKKLTITFVTADAHVAGYDNTACKQSLAAGMVVASGTAITITISPGP